MLVIIFVGIVLILLLLFIVLRRQQKTDRKLDEILTAMPPSNLPELTARAEKTASRLEATAEKLGQLGNDPKPPLQGVL